MMAVDFDKLRIILVPHVLRSGELLGALLKAMYVPLKRMQNLFAGYEAAERNDRRYGPTVKQLSQAVADRLDITVSQVLIGDVQNRDLVDLRRQSDGAGTRLVLCEEGLFEPSDTERENPLPLWADDMVWWNREFTVSLPEEYRSEYVQREVEATLDRWKMVSSRYTITYYTTENDE